MWVSYIFTIPSIFILMFRIEFGSFTSLLHIVCCVIVISVGATGAFVALLRRTGHIQFNYTDADRKTFLYRLARFVEELVHRLGL